MKIKTNCSLQTGIGGSSAWYLTKAFQELGHDIVDGYEADLVINIDGHPHIDRLPGAKYFFWDTDSFMHDPQPDAGTFYDQIFIAGCSEDLQKYPDGTVFLPHAFDPEFHKPHEVEKEFDLVMIGRKDDTYINRNEAVRVLGEHFTILHEEVPPGHEYAKAMSKGTLIFNQSLGERNIPMRFFEGMAIGCLLENYNTNLDPLATAREHYIPYTSIEDLILQVDRYLSNPSLIIGIIKAAQAHALENHTYQHRAREILKYV